MRLLRAITVMAVLVAWVTGTAAACLLPDGQLSEQEKACCREMAPKCGEEMQASHSCCPESVTLNQSSLASRCHDVRPDLAVAQLSSPEGSWSLSGALTPAGSFASPSPPGPAPGAIPILRI